MLLVGSKAFIQNTGLDLDYKDVDIIGSLESVEFLTHNLKPSSIRANKYSVCLIGIERTSTFDRSNVEVFLMDNSPALREYYKYVTGAESVLTELVTAPNEVLYSLKKSHINFPIKFGKHISSYTILHKQLDGNDRLETITQMNFKETENRLGELKTPKLNKSAKKFFGQSNGFITSYFIHDHIHRMVAHNERPIYELMQPDPSSAMCSEKMWNEFSELQKKQCVLEECYVIALERKILPMLFGGNAFITSEEAFEWALGRVCTTLCGGWFRSYATNNYYEIIHLYNNTYVENFLTKYDQGLITRC